MSLLLASASDPTPWMILPFGLMLLSIALMPFVSLHWWEHHYPKVAIGLGSITVAYYLFVLHNGERLLHVAHEYISFIALIGSLFVVSGGIHLTVKGQARPWVNAVFLLIGAVLANFIGTTGASMLLIRPWIRMNHARITPFHVVFFIFIVSNVGGCLTPIGDPPLFLGYLKGVPFFWVLENCWLAWLICTALLIAIFLIVDTLNFRQPRALVEATSQEDKWRFQGLGNVGFLAVIIGAVFLPSPWRELIMFATAVASYFLTAKSIHHANHFNFEPIKEVAWLFVGIFATMVPALDYLELHSGELGLHGPMQFYWFTGILSAFLDNAPTYLTFLAAALGDKGLSVSNPADVLQFIAQDNRLLIAISLGAVFFGACSYIGNGPNFMVRNIASQMGVPMPSFFGYMFKYALPILIPVFALIGLLFFSRWRLF